MMEYLITLVTQIAAEGLAIDSELKLINDKQLINAKVNNKKIEILLNMLCLSWLSKSDVSPKTCIMLLMHSIEIYAIFKLNNLSNFTIVHGFA
ncbi:hypothetical protein ATX59_07455 [Oenococcus oeni]|uniref:Uncharacterized protein n=1 Tax=Oenococcus oeni TaxID=1247 RepID=A0A6N4A4L4_OENOE|nr:hypothetical protein ATX59_07455 [Oenococcus oeni]